MHKRSVISFLIILGLLGGLMLRIYYLSGQQFSQAAERQAGLTVTVANIRGTIYDCHLRPLVNSGTEFRAVATPSPQAIAALSECLDKESLKELTSRLQAGRPVVSVINALPSPTPELSVYEIPSRYTGDLIAPHVVGYMDGDGIKGATGAELVFDELLAGCSGKLSVNFAVDAVGKPLQGIEPVVTNTLDNAKAGVALTIDKDIQIIAESVAKENLKKGAVVIMEPDTGRILALVSLPDFQPASLHQALESKDSPLINRALSNYNCGSVFKIVTAAAALEKGIPITTRFECTGSHSIGDVKFHCHNRLGHGTLGMLDAFAQSCNPYFIRLALQAGGQQLYDMSTALGFDRPIILAEGWKTARAVLPSDTELASPAAVGNLAFGQGSLMASPVHIAQLVSSVVNRGNIIRPTLLRGTVDSRGVLTEQAPAPVQTVFSEATADKLRQMMIYAVENGTGTHGAPSIGGAGGKTGTAQTGWVVDGEAVVQGWYAGFYPAEKPEYVIVVLAEDYESSGGMPATTFRQICDELSMLKTLRETNGIR